MNPAGPACGKGQIPPCGAGAELEHQRFCHRRCNQVLNSCEMLT